MIRPLKWGWIECLVVILFLLNGLLLLPGAQSFRFVIRAAPYLASLASLLFVKRRKGRLPPGALPMQLMLVLLMVNLFHSHVQLLSGLGQVLFQLAIVCPLFWAGTVAMPEERLMRVLWMVFLCSAIGALVGILQVYFPDRFLPAEFSAAANPSWISSLTFVSPSGRVLVRPPGLSDLPGGSAMSGSLAAMLGFAFSSLRSSGWLKRCFCLISAVAGFSVLYLTQCRSLTIMTVVGMLLLCLFAIQQRAIWNGGWMAIAGTAVVAGSFLLALSVGGEKVRDRFLGLTEQGVVGSYQTSRGWFWEYTFGEALARYPLGAGPGRWGMMSVYLNDTKRTDAPPLWVEIQLTGWLYDGGVPMWLLYGTGLITSMLFLYRVAASSRYGRTLPFAAAVVFCVNANIIGASFSGPSFNTTMGLQFWLLTALLYSAARTEWQGPSLEQIRFGYLVRPQRFAPQLRVPRLPVSISGAGA